MVGINVPFFFSDKVLFEPSCNLLKFKRSILHTTYCKYPQRPMQSHQNKVVCKFKRLYRTFIKPTNAVSKLSSVCVNASAVPQEPVPFLKDKCTVVIRKCNFIEVKASFSRRKCSSTKATAVLLKDKCSFFKDKRSLLRTSAPLSGGNRGQGDLLKTHVQRSQA